MAGFFAFPARRSVVLLALALSFLLVACGGGETTAPLTAPDEVLAESTATPSATPLPEPTTTPTPMPTETPTETPQPTATPEVGAQEDNRWWDGVAWQELPEGWQVSVMEDGQMQATDATGEVYSYVGDEWLSKAQVETQKVVEYVEANSEVINQVAMDWITLRATKGLQEAIRSRLPQDEQHFESPLFAIVTDVERFEALVNTMSIEVVGYEQKVSLGDRSEVERVEFVFMSGSDKPDFNLPVFVGHSAVTLTQFGAYKSEGAVYVMMKLGKYLSTKESFNRSNHDDGQFFIDGVIGGLWKLTKTFADIGTFTEKFSYNSSYDNYNPGLMLNRTWLVHMVAVRPERNVRGDFYANSGFYKDFRDWIPSQFQSIIDEMNW